MICLLVHALSGHYRKPGQVGQGHTGGSFPLCPVSTMQGFLESLCGQQSSSFEGEFAYGWFKRPQGHGEILRKVAVWASDSRDKENKNKENKNKENNRVIKVETMYDMTYTVCVKGPQEQLIRNALAGKVTRYGVLYLGESYDLVTHIQVKDEMPTETEWVVPGKSTLLPIASGRGYGNFTVKYGMFDVKTGAPHFHQPSKGA